MVSDCISHDQCFPIIMSLCGALIEDVHSNYFNFLCIHMYQCIWAEGITTIEREDIFKTNIKNDF